MSEHGAPRGARTYKLRVCPKCGSDWAVSHHGGFGLPIWCEECREKVDNHFIEVSERSAVASEIAEALRDCDGLYEDPEVWADAADFVEARFGSAGEERPR